MSLATRIPPRAAQSSPVQPEVVYVLHGFGGRPWLMHRLASYLRRQNYAVRNWGYSSFRQTVAFHAAELRDELDRAAAEDDFRRVHFVTHSLGSIIVRQILCERRPRQLGRIVMLAPPNGGSHMVRALAAVLGGVCPILHEISTKPGSYVNRLAAPPQVEIGVIAASRNWIVSRRSTHLETQTDHVVVRGDHIRLPLLRASAEQTVHFLATGAFRRARTSIGGGRVV